MATRSRLILRPSDLEEAEPPEDLMADVDIALRDAMLKAADAATGLLANLEDKRLQQQEGLAQTESSIARLKAVILAAQAYREPAETTDDGSATQLIDAIVSEEGGAIRVSEIRQAIAERFERVLALSTISNYLSRGKAKGHYNNVDGKWSLTNKGMADLTL